MFFSLLHSESVILDNKSQVTNRSSLATSKNLVGLRESSLFTEIIFSNLVAKSRNISKKTIRILMLGKTGTGKSSTIESILNEKHTCEVGVFKPNATDEVTFYSLSFENVTLILVDTPGLLEGSTLSEKSLRKIKSFLAQPDNTIDVVMFCERIDTYRLEPIDHRVLEAITEHLGREIWRHTILVFTRAAMNNLPGHKYKNFVNTRIDIMQRAMRLAGSPESPPAVLVDNIWAKEGTCGRMVLPDGTVWLDTLAKCVLEHLESSASPFQYDPKQEKSSDPSSRYKWLIPFVIIAQIFFKQVLTS